MAMDCALGMVHLTENTEPGFTWSPGALLRPVLEGAARSYWLTESGIGTKERIRRGMNEYLDSLFWQKKLGPTELVKMSGSDMSEVLAAASLLGFEVGPRSLPPARPTTTDAISLLFDAADAVNSDIFMMYSSAFVHAGPLPMIAYIYEATGTGRPLADSAIALTDRSANMELAGAVLPLIAAAHSWLQFTGWNSDKWSEAAMDAADNVKTTTAAYLAAE